MKCEACGKEGTFSNAVECDVGTYDLDVALGKEPLSVVRVLMLNGFRSRIRADERAKVLAMARERVAQMWRVADARDEWVRLPDVLAVIDDLARDGGVTGGIEPSSPLPLADVPPSPHGSVFGTDAVCMPPVSAEGMTCPDCDGRGYPVGRSADKCGFCGGTGHVLRDHK